MALHTCCQSFELWGFSQYQQMGTESQEAKLSIYTTRMIAAERNIILFLTDIIQTFP
jgi:hypothetical protein